MLGFVAGFFAGGHVPVGVTQEFVGGVGGALAPGDAGGALRGHGQTTLGGEGGELVPHAGNHDVDVLGHGVEEHYRKLVAAVPRHHVGGAGRFGERVRHRAQHVVAEGVAEAVVDGFQIHDV